MEAFADELGGWDSFWGATMMRTMACILLFGLFGTAAGAGPSEKSKGITGFFDSLDPETGMVSGWCYDPMVPSQSITVSIYMDDKTGKNDKNLLGTVTASGVRPDLNKSGIEGNHAFTFTLPAKVKAVKPYALIHVFCSTSKGGPKVELSLSPRTNRAQP